jgi:hypothetical protein
MGPGPSWDVDALHGCCDAKPSVAYLIPDFHNPTGALAGNPERDALAGLERRVPLIVIDETLRELDLRDGDRNLDRPAMPRHLAELLPDAVTIGGFSKIVWSGLRIGWVRAPQRAQRESLRRFTDVQPVPVFEQLIATGAALDRSSPLTGRSVCNDALLAICVVMACRSSLCRVARRLGRSGARLPMSLSRLAPMVCCRPGASSARRTGMPASCGFPSRATSWCLRRRPSASLASSKW